MKLAVVIKVAILLAAAILIINSMDLSRFLALAGAIPWYVFVAGGAIVLVQAWMLAARWKRMTGFFAHSQLTSFESFTAILISFFFSQGLPASIGGDAARIWLLKEQGTAIRTGIRAALVDRFWGFLSLAFLACLGLMWLFVSQPQMSNWSSVVILVTAISIGVLVAAIGWPVKILDWLDAFAEQKIPFTAPIIGSLTRLKRDFDTYNRDAEKFRITVLLSGAVHTLTLFVAALPFALHTESVSLFAFFAAIPPVMLIGYLPISFAGWGVREGAMIVGLGLIGISLENALIISLFMGITVLLVSLLGGVLWLISDTRKSKKPIFANPGSEPNSDLT